MKKILYVLSLGLILGACSKDSVSLESNTEAAFKAGVSNFSSLGNYEGTYVATGTSVRGLVAISILESDARASITLHDGQELKFSADQQKFDPYNEQQIRFSSDHGSFLFSVNADGSAPTVTEVNLHATNGSIVLVKSSSSTAIRSITGSFGCTACDDHPIFGNPELGDSFVWNMVFQGEGTGEDRVTVQVTVGNQTYVVDGVQADPYAVIGALVYCDMDGEFRFGAEGAISWTAAHMFSTVEDCASIIGTWSFSSASYEFDGWLRSDLGCNPSGGGDN